MYKYKTILLSTLVLPLVISTYVVAQSTDPTKPLAYSGGSSGQVEKQKLVLESIIHGDEIHTVVINGKKLQVGDYIGEHRLVAVNNDSAVLRTATERLKLHVFSSVIVK